MRKIKYVSFIIAASLSMSMSSAMFSRHVFPKYRFDREKSFVYPFFRYGDFYHNIFIDLYTSERHKMELAPFYD